MLLDYFLISWNNLKKRRLRSWLTLIGIFIGITAVVALIGLGEGLKTAITSQFGISTTEVITIQASGVIGGAPGQGVVTPLTQQDADAIERLRLIDFSFPRILETGKLEFNDKVVFGMAMSIPNKEKRDFAYEVMDFDIAEGRLLKEGDNRRVVLGYNFLDDKVGLERTIHVGDNVFIQDVKFQVAGITEKKGSFIFDNIVHMNEDAMKDLFNLEDDVDIIVAKIKDKDLMIKAKEDIEELLRKRRNVKIGEEDFSVETPDSILDNVNSILTGVQIFIVMIASISIIIGAIGIVNTMFTSVMERRKHIGVMKSIGAKNSDIFYLFFFESGLMGFIGGFIGTLFGTIISFAGTIGINAWVNASTLPKINFWLIFGALFGSFLIGAVAGIMPALQAASQHPVDALRG